MDSKSTVGELEWFHTPLPRRLLGVTTATTIVVSGTFGAILYVTGFSLGNVLVPTLFAAFFAAVLAIIWYGHLRRTPSRVGFSEATVHIELRNGKTHQIHRGTLESVKLYRVLGEDHADVYRPGGKRETRVHIYGEAARRLKKWFEG